ncbi:MAG: histidine phosphatase family protein [Candidatus Nanopelagicales bacterium]
MPDTSRVLLVRHGQSEGNVARVWTSARGGFPLTALGHEQARSVGSALAGRDVVAVYGSPLVRAQETAAEIGAILGLPAYELEGVEELHVGIHEGVHDDHVGPIAEQVFGAWWRDNDLSGGFEGGETGLQIAERMRAALDLVADKHAGESVVVVSHGGAMAVGVIELCGLDPAYVATHLLKNTDVVELVRTDGVWICESWAGERPPTR